MSGLFTKGEITINAPMAKVWTGLTDPAWTKQYMFGCEVISDWKVGSPVIWKGAVDGVVYVKGHVVKIEPGRLVHYTIIDPNNPNIPDIPENYLTVTYELSEKNGKTVLNVTQGDYSKVALGEERYKHGAEGWNAILNPLKELLEK